MSYLDSDKNQTILTDVVAQVSSVHRGMIKAIIEDVEVNCKISGRFYNEALLKSELPTVGDFVVLNKNLTIIKLLPRKTQIVRKASGKKLEEQILAANIDYAFIVSSLNNEFNARRIERYVAFLDTQDIPYRIILTKSDLCHDIDFYVQQLERQGQADKVIVTSTVSGDGFEHIKLLLKPGTTVVFIGSSGVGKSSIINYFMEKEIQTVNDIREKDGKGRHTTTHRELFILENGSRIIDTPGIRELQFWGGGETIAFEDVEELARQCKYKNCTHKSEPCCAVREAIKSGVLPGSRLKSFEKLQREIAISDVHDMLRENRRKKKDKKYSKKQRQQGRKVDV